MTHFYVIRHGESDGNLRGTFSGKADVELTELGRRQARLTAEYLAKKHIDVAYASDLIRAFETAQIIARPHGIDVIPVPEFEEIDCGRWTEKTFAEIIRLFPEEYELWMTALDKARPGGGESPQEVYERVIKKLTEIAENNDGKNVLIVVHALVIRVLISMLKYGSFKKLTELGWVPNSSVTEMCYENGKFTFLSVGYDGHIGNISTTPKGI